jgi:hypothetical protein
MSKSEIIFTSIDSLNAIIAILRGEVSLNGGSMQLSISYRHLYSTASLDAKITEKGEHLKKYFKEQFQLIGFVRSMEVSTEVKSVYMQVRIVFMHMQLISVFTTHLMQYYQN